MANVTLNAPAGTSEVHILGVRYITAQDGTVTIPTTVQTQAIAAGCTPVGTTPQPVTTTKRPTAGLVVGLCVYDTTLGKPVWWSGTQWKDSQGTVV